MKYAILLIIICTALLMHQPVRDYTGLTVAPYPDIAIDLTTDKVYMEWKLSKKRLTKRGG